MATQRRKRWYRPNTSFCCPGPEPDTMYVFSSEPIPDCLVDADHWAVKKHPHLFEVFLPE
jgi:hypothetical protein